MDKVVPTFKLIEKGDNAYKPVIVDKKNNPIVKVLNANGKCTMFHDHEDHTKDCSSNFYFLINKVATRTFNKNNKVKLFRKKCVRLDISSAQLYGGLNLNPGDGNKEYPEKRRCVIFRTA
jgi:hypothetical protein